MLFVHLEAGILDLEIAVRLQQGGDVKDEAFPSRHPQYQQPAEHVIERPFLQPFIGLVQLSEAPLDEYHVRRRGVRVREGGARLGDAVDHGEGEYAAEFPRYDPGAAVDVED